MNIFEKELSISIQNLTPVIVDAVSRRLPRDEFVSFLIAEIERSDIGLDAALREGALNSLKEVDFVWMTSDEQCKRIINERTHELARCILEDVWEQYSRLLPRRWWQVWKPKYAQWSLVFELVNGSTKWQEMNRKLRDNNQERMGEGNDTSESE